MRDGRVKLWQVFADTKIRFESMSEPPAVAGGFISDDDTWLIHKINRPLPQAVLTL